MKIETLHKSHKKGFIIGVVVICIVGSVLVFKTTRAKYRFTQSIPFVRGTINYKPYDFKMMAMYQQKNGSTCNEDSCYDTITRMPTSGYVINESKSYCTVDGTNKDTNAKLYTDDKYQHVISNLATNEKCYLYFDIKPDVQAILAKYTKSGARANYQNLTTDNSGKVYSLDDDDGTSYYFAGAVNNNWIKFADFYWRIIRFNGNGTMRLIYSGTTAATSGTGTQIGTSQFNPRQNDNMYVGYRYTSGEVNGTGTESIIQGVIDSWYKTNIVNKGYGDKVDSNTGFCGDRDAYTNNTGTTAGGGTGATYTYYGAYIRLMTNSTNPTPKFKCKNTSDLYTKSGSSKGNKSLTYPVGLITADEVNAAGAIYGTGNSSYYLYTGEYYWTMSPYGYHRIGNNTSTAVFDVSSGGNLQSGVTMGTIGVRPVINLKADIIFKSVGNGTSSSPYEVA